MEQYQSQDITKLAKALLSVQGVLQPAVKDALNPFAKNRYASLNTNSEARLGLYIFIILSIIRLSVLSGFHK